MKIGARLRELRKEKNMTLNELSQKSGVALATLSRIENNKMTGTISSHNKICKALNVSIGSLYRQMEDASKIVEAMPKGKSVEHFINAKKSKFELLVTRPQGKKLTPLLIKLEVGGETQEEKNKPGIEVFVYVMAGACDAIIGKSTYSLKKGDSLYFDASLPHSFVNKTKVLAEVICVLSS